MSPVRYVLVTPARNEARFIEGTIRSMIAQTWKPLRWVIASDGSTDGTDAIVEKYLPEHPWIELVRLPERKERHFAGKVHCFNAGFERVKDLDYEIIGNLDGDVTFDPDYFEYLLGHFGGDARLGVTGTPFIEGDETYNYKFASIEHVSGQVQMFRRECFQEIGGYVPIKGGGIDWVAVMTARLKGWKTRTFTDKVFHHHRQMGTGNASQTGAAFKQGKQDYYLGGHPLWQIFRSIFQMKRRPYIVGGICLFFGFFWALATRQPKPVSPELVVFHRRDQMHRLRSLFRKGDPARD